MELNGRLMSEDWSRIVHALETYCITEEASLKKQHVGDREWQELCDYERLTNHIKTYIISNET